jgi:hypothetical protein
MDIFLWGHLKEHVYAFPKNTEDLVARLRVMEL